MCMHLCACAYFSIFLKHCNSSHICSPLRLLSLLGSECDQLYNRLCDRLPAHATTPCRTHEQISSGNWSVSTVACERAFLLHNGAETVLKWQNPRAEALWRLLVFESDWLARDKEWNRWIVWDRVWGLRASETVYLCIKMVKLNLLPFAIYWQIGASKQDLMLKKRTISRSWDANTPNVDSQHPCCISLLPICFFWC